MKSKYDKRRKPYNLWVCVVGIILLLTISGGGFMLVLKNPGKEIMVWSADRYLEQLKSDLNVDVAVHFSGICFDQLVSRAGSNTIIDIDSSMELCREGDSEKYNNCGDTCNKEYYACRGKEDGYYRRDVCYWEHDECRERCNKFKKIGCSNNETCINNKCILPTAERKRLGDIGMNIRKEFSLRDYNLKGGTITIKVLLYILGGFLMILGAVLCRCYIRRYYWKYGEDCKRFRR